MGENIMVKKIFLMIITVSVIICCISACSDNDEAKIFNFKLDFYVEGSSGIDTYEGTLTKGLRGGITETIDFTVPEDKKQEFYKAFLEYEIYDLPEDVSGVDNSYRPITEYTFTYTYNNETRTVTCTGADTSNKDLFEYNTDTIPATLKAVEHTPHTRFIVFVMMIREYIDGTEEWQNIKIFKNIEETVCLNI
jgi:hypothetical protein